ncbi:MAG: TonB-dependent receptor [Bacteroidota bacterium]
MKLRQPIEPEQKALEINLDESVYGTFAEIGAGQEVARHFFQVGAAAGTIAKTMSAYDKVYSDKIYGVEPTGRYVCESRLYKMLDHEYGLLEDRLGPLKTSTRFFAFADTVSAINYSKTSQGHGWMGMRFQLDPQGHPNDVVLHVKMKDKDNSLQQQAIGILGVNLVYACFYYHHDPEQFITSLVDNLRERIEVDMIRMTGPELDHIDNRLLSLMLVKNGLSKVAMFDAKGHNIHASEYLYKQHVLVVRGSFRPATLVNQDMLKVGYRQFVRETEVDVSKTRLLCEITLDNLRSGGEINEKDFLDRAELLCGMDQVTLISDCEEHHKLIAYFSDYRILNLGLVVGVKILLNTINQKFEEHKDGDLLAAFGELFTKNVKLYIYPSIMDATGELLTSENLPIPEGVKFLYRHLLDNRQLVDIEDFNSKILAIYSKDVLKKIKDQDGSWEKMVPASVARMIKEQSLFGFSGNRVELVNRDISQN